jgi:hypothetical protein
MTEIIGETPVTDLLAHFGVTTQGFEAGLAVWLSHCSRLSRGFKR